MYLIKNYFFFFFFNDTATTEIYTLSLHDALPICCGSGILHYRSSRLSSLPSRPCSRLAPGSREPCCATKRSEEHTSELQSPCNLVCRLLLEKKKKTNCITAMYPSHSMCTNCSRCR